MGILLVSLHSFTLIGIHAFSIYNKIVFGAKLIYETLTLLALRFRTHLGISLLFWVDAAGSLSSLDLHTRKINSDSDPSQHNTFYTCCFDFVRTSEVNEKVLLLLATSIYYEYLELTRLNLPLLLWYLYSSSHKPFLLVASWLVDIWLTLICTFLIYPKIERSPIYWHLRFASPYQDMNLHCEHLGSTTKLLLLLFWFLYSIAHEPFFLVASRLVDNCSDLYITHSRPTPKIERLDRWQRRSADIHKFLNLTWTSTFPAPCWGLIPLPGSAKSFNFQIETISRSSVYLLQIDIIGISAFNARPGTNHPYFLAFLLAFTDSSNLPAHNLRCCLLVADSFALVCRFIPSSKEKRNLDQQLSTEMDIIARSARLGTNYSYLLFCCHWQIPLPHLDKKLPCYLPCWRLIPFLWPCSFNFYK